MRTVLILVLLLALSAVACTKNADPPVLDRNTSAELEARAIWRACTDSLCVGAPMLIEDMLADDVRGELARFTDEVQYVSTPELEALAPRGERFPNDAVLFGAGEARVMDEPFVAGVDVSMSKGPGDFLGRTYLFRWDGTTWVDTTPETVGVTVTSAVS